MIQTKGEKLPLALVNYLAHILLSGNDPLLLVGNFMGDGVKGSSLEHLEPMVRNGVKLHRAIDSFTDEHELAVIGRQRLRDRTGKYAGVVLDMFYDHVLSAKWDEFHPVPLNEFVEEKYRLLTKNIDHMPTRIQHMLPHMIAGDWLSGYGQMEGLSKALNGISRRASKSELIVGSEVILAEHFISYYEEFKQLFADVQQMSAELIRSFQEQ